MVVRLSSLTDRVLAVRVADGGLVEFHDLAAKAVLMPVGAAAVLVAGWVLVRAGRRHGRGFRTKVLYTVAGAVLAAAMVLAPGGFGRGAFDSATTAPVTDLTQVELRTGAPPPVAGRGAVARSGDAAVRVLEVRRGAPEGAARWMSEFQVLTLVVEETRSTAGEPVAVRLVADEHGAPVRVDDCAGALGALTGAASAPGTAPRCSASRSRRASRRPTCCWARRPTGRCRPCDGSSPGLGRRLR
ncbi:hypothetical protein [Saccharothrix luteola]|uniref:hypothetical protein n=1 Tax=Saccharothrix luteola TaxID=2893018 RepID=UPI001E4A8520|nr:hypothetical protein [Saccharothrix luteola]MCC8243308.1 hypothetical protein [Saccharothrix luteola]